MKKAWWVMLACYFASVAITLNQFKVPPVMPTLMEELNVSMATGGWLMSIFAVAAVILAIPAAFLLARLGPKTSGLVAVGSTALGAIIGAFAPSAGILLFARVIEGVGLGLIGVIAPAIISMWFKPEERGLPMGIWATWVPVGSLVMYNIAAPLEGAFGWSSVWWFGAIIAIIAFIVYALVVTAPDEVAQAESPSLNIGETLRSVNTWLLALAFAGFNFSFIAFNTWGPSFLVETLKLGQASANFYISVTFFSVIPACVLAGWVLDRVSNRKIVLSISLLISAVVFIWAFNLGSVPVVLLYVIILGLIGGFAPTAVFTLAPETMARPELAGFAMGIINVGQNLGMLAGPPIVGAVVAASGWGSGAYPLVIGAAVAFLATLVLKIRPR